MRSRKRVVAIPRAPNGSAFQTCAKCGASVAIALADMHRCHGEEDEDGDDGECAIVRRFKGVIRSSDNRNRFLVFSTARQPRSPFRFFMEEFMSKCEVAEERMEFDGRGFETWKNMSREEREPYYRKAEVVNSEYVQDLIREVEEEVKPWVNDEADSAQVGKFDQFSPPRLSWFLLLTSFSRIIGAHRLMVGASSNLRASAHGVGTSSASSAF